MDRQLLMVELTRDECRANKPEKFPYVDTVGKVTIGIGHNLTDKGISDHISFELFHDDVDEAVGWLDHNLPWWDTLKEEHQRVFVNMVFNLKDPKLLGFPKFTAAVRGGAFEVARAEMLDSVWAKQVGERAQRLADMIYKPEVAHDVVE